MSSSMLPPPNPAPATAQKPAYAPSRVRLAKYQPLLRQFLQFGIVGSIGFVFDTATVYALRGSFGVYVAGIIAYIVAATVTWLLNRIWTFRGRGGGALHRQWALFLAANLLGFVLNRGTFALLVTYVASCRANPVIAIAAGVCAGMFVNFFMMKKLVFR